jgi:hypothetical protein
MSAQSQIFFNSGKNTQDTINEIQRLLCISLDHEPEEGFYSSSSLTLEVILYEEHVMDEDHIDFQTKKPIRYTKYKYELEFLNLYKSGDYRDEVRQTLAHYAYYLMTTRLGYEALLVEDLHTFVAESPEPAA